VGCTYSSDTRNQKSIQNFDLEASYKATETFKTENGCDLVVLNLSLASGTIWLQVFVVSL
jgi:hypothetical protein